MSWDYIVDKDGEMEIIVSRWYNQNGDYEQRYRFRGFKPFEAVQVEICGEDDESKLIRYDNPTTN